MDYVALAFSGLALMLSTAAITLSVVHSKTSPGTLSTWEPSEEDKLREQAEKIKEEAFLEKLQGASWDEHRQAFERLGD